jgi:membrane protease YdiL (CAAX protease family)
MKRLYIFFEILIFFLICAFIIFPPFFTPRITDISQVFTWTFPWAQAGFAVFCIVLYFFTRKIFCSSKKFFYPSMLCLAILICSALILKFISAKTGSSTALPTKTYLPQTALEGLFCFLTFLFGAVYEEIIYRYYFTDALKRLLGYTKMPDGRVMFFITEGLGLLVFAFAHLYMGPLSVVNAAIAHVVLRILYKKTGLIWNSVLIHFVFNIISLILL